MLSRRKPLAALAALTAALAVAIPAASASAAAPTVDPQVCQLLSPTMGPLAPTAFFGGASLARVLANARSTVSCPAPPPQPPPAGP
jgi:hypothetical protein